MFICNFLCTFYAALWKLFKQRNFVETEIRWIGLEGLQLRLEELSNFEAKLEPLQPNIGDDIVPLTLFTNFANTNYLKNHCLYAR